MQSAVRLGDFVRKICRGRVSGPFISASRTTFVNGRGQVRLFDSSLPGIAVTGSRTTFVDGRPAVRIKDRVICGIIQTSSSDTFIG
ncbi:PAAR domain-containing protein [Calothrix sp. FACHB-1219]|uniref:PAAR domain-containing protein n=1 Tax=unclassified Calothrix TaxID=2619626 RepID=UPI0016899600|nr:MULTISPECIES: PAAR domain-containing protein [unclassified Calothrix]MBD2201570.1 PAAR domain-containing protein [Calothrix sp. FACHB-168]MBD2217256.1 PAAR domain-containing protein [Calothrix sp. FACHB-1219]